jgi:beta-lactamase family protein
VRALGKCVGGAGAGLLALFAVVLPAAAATPAPGITLHSSRAQIVGAHNVTLSGVVTNAPAGALVRLYKSPFPYPVAALVRTAAPAADGSFSFSVHPDRSTRYRVIVPGTSAVASVQIVVVGRTITKVKALPLGRAGVTVVIFHPRDLRWGRARVSWSFGLGSRGRFNRTPATRSKKLSPYVTEISTIVTLPAGRFRWRACFHSAGDHALANPHRPPGCAGRGYFGSGRLPEGFPSPAAVGRAAGYLRGRAGRTAFAVVDSEGRLSGVNEHWTFVSASVVKAMLLVAYLRRLDSMGRRSIDSFSNSFLYPMIHVSDNSAATQTWSIVGDAALYRLAHEAGMTDFSIVGIWANAQISAADQAKFFFVMDSLIPRQFDGYARGLLSGIAGYESWGIPAVARPRGYAVFFKGGWRGTGLGQLVHQVGRLEGHGVRFSMAVMTDGDPSMGYGIGTIQGVTGSLL